MASYGTPSAPLTGPVGPSRNRLQVSPYWLGAGAAAMSVQILFAASSYSRAATTHQRLASIFPRNVREHVR
jgi:hypothetical protein